MEKIVLLLFLFLTAYPTAVSEATSLEKAQDFVLPDTDGGEVSLSSFSGRHLVIDFFAIWCQPCKFQITHLRELRNQIGSNISIVSIGVDPSESLQQLREYQKKYGLDWKVAKDTKFVSMRYGVTAIPTLVLVDPSGNVVRTYVGVTEPSRIIQDLPFKPSRDRPVQRGSTSTMTDTLIVLAAIAVLASIIVFSRRRKKKHPRTRK
jgi:peroxiredoxin